MPIIGPYRGGHRADQAGPEQTPKPWRSRGQNGPQSVPALGTSLGSASPALVPALWLKGTVRRITGEGGEVPIFDY